MPAAPDIAEVAVSAPKGPWAYLRKYKLRVSIGIVLLLATNILFLAEPILLGKIIDALQKDDPADEVTRLAILMVVFAVATAITRIGSRVALFNAARMAEYDLRSDLFAQLMRFEPAYFRKNPTGDVMSRLTNDVQTVRALYGPGVLNVVNTAVAFISVFTMMLIVDPFLTLWALLPYPSMVLIGRLFAGRLYKFSRAVQAQLGRLSSTIQEDLSGIGIIKAYSLEKERRKEFVGMSKGLLKRNMTLVNVRGQLIPALTGLASISTVVVLYAGGVAVIDDRISLGELIEFNSYLARLVWPTLALGWMLSLFQRGLAAWARLEDILRTDPGIVDGPGPDPETVRGDVEMRGLSIEIDGATILHDIDLKMPAGTVTAVVGRTGSGKTSLVRALPRLIDVPKGTVFLDGHDITDLSLPTLRNAIGYAPQEAFLFSTTIARNIAFGYERAAHFAAAKDAGEDADKNGDGKREPLPHRPVSDGAGASVRAEERDREIEVAQAASAATDSRLLDASRAAGLSRDIDALPAGFDTVVGERGVTLSGGQRQRVALARALATMPKVLILDDSLSSVDAETERDILAHLTQLMTGRTAILISHRVAAVKRADNIVVLDGGRVVEQGTHDQLLAAGGVYAEVYRSQLDPDELDATEDGGPS